MAKEDHEDLKSIDNLNQPLGAGEYFIRNTDNMKFDILKANIQYKFNEPRLLEELKQYIVKTYDSHYNTSKIQAFEEIVDAGYGFGFAMGNVTKYNKRFGKKAGRNRDDLMKQLHYALLALYAHDYEKELNES